MQRLAKKWRREGRHTGLVPTMGYLHDGHMSLAQVARRQVGKSGRVILSIYVNPTQFGPQEDLAKYPRDLKRDFKLCREAGIEVVFTPDDGEIYPGKGEGKYSTYVVEEKLSQIMEGAARPAHFRGVTTVVAKLFNIVLPDVAIFGQKDFQQATIIRRMTADLNFPVKIIMAPTRRESDGLAMSSRNKYLTSERRTQATVLWRAIEAAQKTVNKLPSVSASKLKTELKKLIETEPDARVDYVEFFEPDTLEPVMLVAHGHQMALAVLIGKTRLIDNARL